MARVGSVLFSVGGLHMKTPPERRVHGCSHVCVVCKGPECCMPLVFPTGELSLVGVCISSRASCLRSQLQGSLSGRSAAYYS